MTFEELLKQFNLGGQFNLFADTGEGIAKALGYTDELSKKLADYFTPFDRKSVEDIAKKAEDRKAERTQFLDRGIGLSTENLESQFGTGFKQVGRNLEDAYGQIRTAVGQSGFSGSGAGERMFERTGDLARESIEDLMTKRNFGFDNLNLKRDEGMFGILDKFGTEKATIATLLQRYLSDIRSQKRKIDQLDPYGRPGTFVSGGGGGGITLNNFYANTDPTDSNEYSV